MSNALLVVHDDPQLLARATQVLEPAGYHVHGVGELDAAVLAFSQAPFGVVLTGLSVAGGDGLGLIAAFREHRPAQEAILISPTHDSRVTEAALRAGLGACLSEPLEPVELLLAVRQCLERAALRKERDQLQLERAVSSQDAALQRRGLELLSLAELDAIEDRLLQLLLGTVGAASGALWGRDERGQLVLRGFRGLVDRRQLPPRLEPHVAQGFEGRVPWLSGEGRSALWHIPLHSDGQLVGVCQLGDPVAAGFDPLCAAGVSTVASFGAAALRQGRRVQALQRQGLRDPESAAYNLSYFTDYASKEIYKARRYGRTFSLLTLAIDSLASLKHRVGGDEARRVPRAIIRALGRMARDSDVVAKAGEGEYYLLLPETDFFGAMMFLRRAFAAIGEEPELVELEQRLPLALVAGAATFPRDGEDFDELVHRCRRRMDERRVSLHRRLLLEGLDFWEQVELLVGQPTSPKLPYDERAEPSRRGKISPSLFDELQAEVGRELLRDPTARGLLYLGGPEVRASAPLAVALEGAPPKLGTRVYSLGRRADLSSHPAVTPVFIEGDERLDRNQFLLWMSENATYAFLQRVGVGMGWGFHSSDAAVVEGLISRLQAAYDLQPY